MRPILFVVPAAALIALAGCGRQPAPGEAGGPSIKVQTVEAQIQRTPDEYDAAGTVRAKMSATVAAKVMGAIQEIPVHDGDPVANGQLLARLDDRELRAEFDLAKADSERFKTLVENEAASRQEYEKAYTRFRIAEAALSHAQIAAPFDGVVARKLCDVGDMATPGKTLFVVEQASAFQLIAEVPERYARAMSVGKSVYVTIDATGERCEGKVSEFTTSSDPTSRSFNMKIDLTCQQPLKSGLFGRAELLIGERPALFVPKSAVRERGQLTFIFVAHEGAAQMRLVKTGKTYLDAVEVLSGLQAGERVVVQAEGELTDGSRVAE
jgi:RND family efflux transporter MFP subunit